MSIKCGMIQCLGDEMDCLIQLEIIEYAWRLEAGKASNPLAKGMYTPNINPITVDPLHLISPYSNEEEDLQNDTDVPGTSNTL